MDQVLRVNLSMGLSLLNYPLSLLSKLPFISIDQNTGVPVLQGDVTTCIQDCL